MTKPVAVFRWLKGDRRPKTYHQTRWKQPFGAISLFQPVITSWAISGHLHAKGYTLTDLSVGSYV
jgi:hypothetical protein